VSPPDRTHHERIPGREELHRYTGNLDVLTSTRVFGLRETIDDRPGDRVETAVPETSPRRRDDTFALQALQQPQDVGKLRHAHQHTAAGRQ
jgi:hypothetical protein